MTQIYSAIWDHYASMSWWKQSISDGTVSTDCYKTSYKLIRTWRKASKIWFHSPFRTFFPCVLHKNSRKPKRRPISPSRSCAQSMKINRPWTKSNQFRISGYISIPNSLPFLPYVRHKMPGKPKFQPFRHDKVAHKVKKNQQTNTPNLLPIFHAFSTKCLENSSSVGTITTDEARAVINLCELSMLYFYCMLKDIHLPNARCAHLIKQFHQFYQKGNALTLISVHE